MASEIGQSQDSAGGESSTGSPQGQEPREGADENRKSAVQSNTGDNTGSRIAATTNGCSGPIKSWIGYDHTNEYARSQEDWTIGHPQDVPKKASRIDIKCPDLEAKRRLVSETAVRDLPRRCLNSYQKFVRENAATVTQVESALRSAIYLLPGRFHQSPVAAESLHTGLNLLTVLHTTLLAPAELSYRNPQRRYDLWAGAKSAMYTRALALLRTIQYTQLLLEMAAKRAGEKARWRLVVTLEIVKAACRFLMLRVSGHRMVVNTELNGDIQERSVPSAPQPHDEPRPIDLPYRMPRTGSILPPLPTPAIGQSAAQFLDANILTADQIRPAHQLVHHLQSLQSITAESLWILRPLIYALALQQLQSDSRRDWRPWSLGVGMELLSQELGKRSVAEEIPGGWGSCSSVERDETSRRAWNMTWWGVRGAFHERVTGRWMRKMTAKGRGIWGLDLLTGIVDDYDWMWSEHFFATATS